MTSHVSTAADRMVIADRTLLAANDLDPAQLGRALHLLLGRGTDFADLYLERRMEDQWGLQQGRVTQGAFAITQGVGARAVTGDRTAFAYGSDLSPRALAAVVDAARGMRRHGGDARQGSGVAAFRPDAAPGHFAAIADGAMDAASARIALLRRIDALARDRDPRISQVNVQISVGDAAMLVAASDGTLAADVRPLVQLHVSVMAEEAGRRAGGTASFSGRCALDAINDGVVERMVARAVRIALVNLAAGPAPTGVMPVVLGPGFPGLLLHEAVGHGLESDAHRTRSSVFAGRMGNRIAAPGVTVVDDGTIPGARGSLNVDDEGQPTQRNVLIEDGRLVGLMQDRLNARLTNGVPTGNGRRQSYAHLPMPRMTNTMLTSGDCRPEEIIATVGRGLYAVDFGGGTVDITSGQFNFTATEAYLIENGRVTSPVRGATIIGMGHEALTHIRMIGNDPSLDAGLCIKEGQSLPVGVGQPTVRVDELMIGGVG